MPATYYIYKNQNASFHFPKKLAVLITWFESLDLHSSPPNCSRICAEHFSLSDLIVDCNGRKTLKTGVTPKRHECSVIMTSNHQWIVTTITPFWASSGRRDLCHSSWHLQLSSSADFHFSCYFFIHWITTQWQNHQLKKENATLLLCLTIRMKVSL